jgi:hypothetical protein
VVPTLSLKMKQEMLDNNNITIRTTGADKIDGTTSVILESPYGAVNIYTNGSDKFFIY